MKIKLHIVDNNWLEILLKQYFTDLIFINDGDADIVINDLDIKLNQNNQVWQLSEPIIIRDVINIIEQAQKKITEKIINIGPVKFYPDQRLCNFQNQEIELTQKESEILLYLANRPQGVNKATLLNDIWGYCDEISTRTLETHIYKLRNKFADKYEIIACDQRAHYHLLYSAMTQEEE